MDRARRKAGHGRGHRRVGRALRPGRWSPLPRDHRLPALLRRGPQLGRRLQDLGGRTRHLGRHRARRGRCLDRLSPARNPAAGLGGRPGPRYRAGPGLRTLGQLVQPGAVRPGHRAAVGGGDLRGPEPGRRDLPPDLPVRVAVVHRCRAPGPLGRPPLHARPRTGLRPVRRRVLRRPRLDRVHARRRGAPHPGRPAERLDLDRRLRAGGRLPGAVGEAAAGPRVGRRAGHLRRQGR